MKINIQYDVNRPIEIGRVIRPVPNTYLRICDTRDTDDMWHVGTVTQIKIPIERKSDDELLSVTIAGETDHHLKAYVIYFIEDGVDSEDYIKYDKNVTVQPYRSKLSNLYNEYMTVEMSEDNLEVVYEQLKADGVDIFKLLTEFKKNMPLRAKNMMR